MSGMTMKVKVRAGMVLQRKVENQKRHVERGRTESSGKVMIEIGRKKESKDVLMSAQSVTKCVALVVQRLGVSVFCLLSVGSLWMIEKETGDLSTVWVKMVQLNHLLRLCYNDCVLSFAVQYNLLAAIVIIVLVAATILWIALSVNCKN